MRFVRPWTAPSEGGTSDLSMVIIIDMNTGEVIRKSPETKPEATRRPEALRPMPEPRLEPARPGGGR